MPRTIPSIALLLSALAAPLAAQTVHHVPQDHATIQEAVNATVDGDTVQISAGTYEEAVTVTGRFGLLITAKGKVVIAPVNGTALTLSDCGSCTVEKIRVTSGDSYGFLLVDTSDTVLSKCRVDDSGSDGIRVEGGHDNTLDKCTVKKAVGNGIVLSESKGGLTHDDVLTKCAILQVGQHGVVVQGNDNLIDSCLISKPIGNGAIASPGATAHDNLFLGCKVLKPGGIGVLMDGDNNRVAFCKVTQPGDRGVHVVGGAGVIVEDSKITKSGDDSVKAEIAATGTTVRRNKISASLDDGLEMDADDSFVEDNTISGCHDDGIEVDGLNGLYTDNTCNGNKDDGIVLSEGTGNTLSGNKAHGNKGFDLDDLLVGDNTIDGTNKFGTTFP